MLHITKLTVEDAEELYQFEAENRSFFEKMIPSRGDAYYDYDTFYAQHLQILEEDRCYFYLMRHGDSDIIGRVNLIDLDEEGIVTIGYRIGERFAGRGLAKEAVRLAISEAKANSKVKLITAKTTNNNVASQKVLERNGFSRKDGVCDDFYTNKHGETYAFIHYLLSVNEGVKE